MCTCKNPLGNQRLSDHVQAEYKLCMPWRRPYNYIWTTFSEALLCKSQLLGIRTFKKGPMGLPSKLAQCGPKLNVLIYTNWPVQKVAVSQGGQM